MALHLNLPPSSASYSADLAVGAVGSQTRGGAGRYRNDIIGGDSLVTVTWILGRTQYDFLVGFIEGLTENGTIPFTIDLIINNSLPDIRTVQVVPNTFQLIDQEGLRYTVSAQLAVRRSPQAITEKAAYSLVYLASDGKPKSYASLLGRIVNEILPGETL